LRFAFSLFVLLGLAAGSTVAAQAATLTCYDEIPATMLSTITSQSGYSGEVFKYKTIAPTTSNGVQKP
jgi:hypothetical protein